jgi:hypothetical protein
MLAIKASVCAFNSATCVRLFEVGSDATIVAKLRNPTTDENSILD